MRAGAGSNYPFLTSKERDNETGLDYFLARYYSSTQGRFTSPDEFSGGPDELYDFADAASENPTFYADLANPQSLNKYQYTYNNPLNMTDDDGHCPVCVVIEVAGTAWDAYETYKTVRDPSASRVEKVVTTVAAAAGVFLPGGGYSALSKTVIKNAVKREAKEAAAKKALDTAEAAKPTARGLESEKRVLDDIGETKNTKKVSSPEGNSVPDYQNKTTVGEIKDSKRVSDTRQVRIQRDAAGASKRKHVVHTGSNTRVSRRVQEGSEVRRRKDLGPQ